MARFVKSIAVSSATTAVQLDSTSTGPIAITLQGSAAGWRVAFSSASMSGTSGEYFVAGGASSVITIVADVTNVYVAGASGTISAIQVS